MEKGKILFVSQEITPFLPETFMSRICRYLPQAVHEKGKEIRTFMPKFGNINSRKNQLHEVIRLSGMNLIIEENDHPLIIKVSSIQQARMQVYFIDNEDYFQRKFMFRDNNQKFFPDNDERSVFFNRSVIETVKKLGWAPDIIHLHGWMSALTSLFIKSVFKDNPLFYDSKIVMSLYNDLFTESFSPDFYKKVKLPEMPDNELELLKAEPDYLGLMKTCIKHADGIILAEDNINNEIINYIKKLNLPVIKHSEDTYVDDYCELYDRINVEESVEEEVFS